MATPREVMQEMINMVQGLLDGYTDPRMDNERPYAWYPMDEEMTDFVNILRNFSLRGEDYDGNKFFTARAEKIAKECMECEQLSTYDIKDRIDKAKKQAKEEQPEQPQQQQAEQPEPDTFTKVITIRELELKRFLHGLVETVKETDEPLNEHPERARFVKKYIDENLDYFIKHSEKVFLSWQQEQQEQPNPYEIPPEVREQAERQEQPTGQSHNRDDLTR